jgi:hypothetical protein
MRQLQCLARDSVIVVMAATIAFTVAAEIVGLRPDPAAPR